MSKNSVGSDVWVGTNILGQYFRERFYSNSVVMPNKFTRLALKKSDAEVHTTAVATEGGALNSQPSYDDKHQYLDMLEDSERKEALKAAEAVEIEEDEEYRVRSSVVTAMACVRAQDGQTPPLALQFLETVLDSEDAEMVTNLVFSNEELLIEETFKKLKARVSVDSPDTEDEEANEDKKSTPPLSYVSSMLVADALLALCHVNAMHDIITDPTTGKTVQSSAPHPLSRLTNLARGWLEWELYRENIRSEVAGKIQSGISGNCYDVIAPSAIIALSNLAILKQSTTDAGDGNPDEEEGLSPDVTSAKYYADIFDSSPYRNDLTRAASAQALCCICCAAVRFEKAGTEPVGLLTCLEFLLDRINGKCDIDNGDESRRRNASRLTVFRVLSVSRRWNVDWSTTHLGFDYDGCLYRKSVLDAACWCNCGSQRSYIISGKILQRPVGRMSWRRQWKCSVDDSFSGKLSCCGCGQRWCSSRYAPLKQSGT